MSHRVVRVGRVKRLEQRSKGDDVNHIRTDAHQQLVSVRQSKQINSGLCCRRADSMRVFNHLAKSRIARYVGITFSRQSGVEQYPGDVIPLTRQLDYKPIDLPRGG